MKKLALFLAMLLTFVVSAFAGPYDAWTKYRTVTLNTATAGVTGSVANYPLLVRLTNTNPSTGSDVLAEALSGGADIRFTTANGRTALSYQIERWTNGTVAEIWVKVPVVAGSSTTSLRIFWGNAGAVTASNAAAVFDSLNGFRAVYHMNEATSANLTDATGMGHTATVGSTNPTNSTDGLGIGKTLTRVANTGYLVAKSPKLNFPTGATGAFTMSAWVKPTTCNFSATNARMAVISRMANNGAGGYSIMTNNLASGSWQYRFNTGLAANGAAGSQLNGLNTGCTANAWQYVSYSYGGGADITAAQAAIQGYVNGSTTGTTTSSGTGTLIDTTMGIGRVSDASTNFYFGGSLDEVRVSQGTRSADWHKLDYETQKPTATAISLGTSATNVDVLLSGPVYSQESATYPLAFAITPNTLTVTGTVDTVTITPTLPTGLVLDGLTGSITGTPTVATPATDYVVTISNDSNTVLDTITLATVLTPPTSVTYSAQTPTYVAGTVITANTPVVAGMATSYSVAPSLPAGLALNTSTGAVTGTPTDTSSLSSYVFSAINAEGSALDTITIKVNPAIPATITYTRDTVVYYQNVAIATNTPVLTATVGPVVVDSFTVSPALPTGLSLDKFTGVITGSPSVASAVTNYTVTAYNVTGTRTKNVRFTVNAAPISVFYTTDTAVYQAGLASQIAPNRPTVVGVPTSYSVTPPLPAGLTLDTLTGVITGTPTDAGQNNYIVSATNPAGSAKDTLFLTVNASETYGSWSSSKLFNLNTGAAGAGTSTGVGSLPVLVRLTAAHGVIFGAANADGSDIRFANANGMPLAYEKERWNSSDSTAAFWVLLDTIPSSGTTSLRVHWGNPAATDRSEPSRVFNTANGYQGVWHLNEASGNVNDATVNGITGTNVGTTNVAGAVGSARKINANFTTNNYINLGNPAILNTITTTVTMEAWIRPTLSGVTGTGSNNGGGNFRQILGHKDNMTFRVSPNTGSPTVAQPRYEASNSGTVKVAHSLTADTLGTAWIHLVAVGPAAGSAWTLYRNGISVGTVAGTAALQNHGTENWTIGGWMSASGTCTTTPGVCRLWMGDIDEMRISNVTRTADWVKLQYKNQKPTANPVADLAYAAPSYSFVEEQGITPIPVPTLAMGTATHYSVSPALPAGLILNTATGAITGTPADAATSQSYTVTAYGDSAWSTTASFNLQVTSIPPASLAYTLDTAVYKAGFDIAANNPVYSGTITSWTVTPSLPSGLVFGATGGITGTPLVASAKTYYTVIGTGPDGSDTTVLALTVQAPSEDFSTWSGSRSITLNTSATGANVTGTLTKYPLLVRLGAGEASIFTQALSNGADVRFARSNGVSRLPYQIVSWDTAQKAAEIWVRVDTVYGNNSSQSIKMFWGKAGAFDSSKGAAVFDTTDGFRAVWHMNEASGNISDATVNAVPGTNTGTIATAGLAGLARNFAGGNADNNTANPQFIHVGNPASLSFGGPFTMESWVRWLNLRATTGGSNHFRTVLWRGGSGVSQETHLRTSNSTTPVYQTGSFTPDVVAQSGTISSADSAQWVQLVSVYDSTSSAAAGKVFRLYRNGVQVGTATGAALTAGLTSVADGGWQIGRSGGGLINRYFSGDLDEIRISSVTRSADYVKLNYESQKPLQTLTDIGLQAPTLAYAPDSATYTQGVGITAVTPSLTGTGITVSVVPSLPTGLVLNATTGAITGTASVFAAKTKYTITATNLGGSATDSIFIRVNPAAPTGMAYVSNNLTLMVGTAMAPDSVAITNLVDSFTVAPALPAGLSLNASNGAITGTPSAITASADYVITATNVTGTAKDTVTIVVNPAIPIISYATPKVYTLGVVIDTLAPVSSGGPVASYAISPSLNAATGLTFNTTTGTVTGTATTLAVAADYTIIATNVSGTDTAIVNVTVNDAVPVIAYTSPHIYTIGTQIDTLSPVSTGGTVVGYTITPDLNTATGLAFNTTTGKVTGTPTTAAAAANYTIIATNTGGSDTAVVNIASIYAVPVIAYATPKIYTVGIAIDTLKPTSTGGPLTSFTITPNLNSQTGLAFDTTTGAISGTPSLTHVATDYTIIVTGPGGLDTAVVNILTSNEIPPSIVYADTAVYLRGVAIASLLVDTTGSGPIDSITVSPALPAGLALNKTTGTVTGTPTVVANAANYTFTAYGLGGVDSEVLHLTVIDSVPVISYTSPQTYAVGTLITPLSPVVSQGAVVSYAISPNLTTNTGLAFSTSTGAITGTPTIAQTLATYTIIATNSGGMDTATVDITVQGAPLITTAPHDTAVVSGAAASFTVAASAAGALSYQWKKAGVDIDGATSATYSVVSATLADTGVYTVVVTSTLNATTTSTTSIAAHLYVNVAPVIATAPHDTTVVSGSAASFTVAAAAGAGSSAGTYSYQWKKNGTNVASAGTSATYALASAVISDTGSYTVVVTRTLGTTTTSTTSTAGKLRVNVAPVITTAPHDTTVVSGAASFTVAATAEGALSYQWKKSGVNIGGATSATYSIPSVVIADTGSYTVAVTSTLNLTTATTTTTAVRLYMNVAPVIATAPHDSTVVSGTNVSFTVAAATGPGSSAGTLSYQWRKGVTNVSTGTGGTTASYSITGATLSDTTGLLNVVITRTLNGTTTTTTSGNVALRVNVAPTITTQVRDTTVVAGGPVSFTVGATVSGGGVLSYQWKKNGTNVSTGTGGTTATYALAAAAIADTATYTVTVSSTLNGNVASVTTATGGALKVNVTPSLTTSPRDTTVIAGAASSFTVVAATGPGTSAGVLSYQWRKNGTNVASGGTAATYAIASSAISDTGSYTVVVTRTLNATTTSFTSTAGILRVNAVPVIATAPRDTTIISGANASFTVAATVVGGGVLSYQWKKDGVNVATAGTAASYALTGATLADTAAYTVTVTSTLNGTNTSVTTTAANLRVNVTPSLTTNPRDSTVVAASPVSFAVVAAAGAGSSAGVLSYQWRKNGTNVASAGTAATYAIASAAISDTGSYTVVVTRTLNATTTTFTSPAGVLRINAAPVISTQPRDTTVIAGVAGTFTVGASAVGGGVLTYQWRKNGTNVATGGTSATYSVAGSALADTGAYSVVVTSTLSGTVTTTTSNAVNLRVNVAPTISTQPEATQTIVVGGNVTKTVVVAAGVGSSAGTLSYQWRKNGVNLVNGAVVGGGTVGGATTASLTISTLTAADSGTYTVVITRTLNGTVTTTTSANSNLAAPVAIMPDAFVIRVNGQERPYAFQLPAGTTTEKLTLSIMDVWGRTVWSQTAYPVKDKLTEVSWNGKSANGRQASAGMYVVRIAVLNGGKTTTYVRKSVTLKPR